MIVHNTVQEEYCYTCFEASNTEPCVRPPAVPDDCMITLFKQVNIRTLNRLTFTRPQGQMDYQDSEHVHLPAGKRLHWHFQPLLPQSVAPTLLGKKVAI